MVKCLKVPTASTSFVPPEPAAIAPVKKLRAHSHSLTYLAGHTAEVLAPSMPTVSS